MKKKKTNRIEMWIDRATMKISIDGLEYPLTLHNLQVSRLMRSAKDVEELENNRNRLSTIVLDI